MTLDALYIGLMTVWYNIDLCHVYGLLGAVMSIIGGFILVSGFFGKGYNNLLNESMAICGYNKSLFISLADQKSSGIIGFTFLLIGFVEQAISYVPYSTTLTVTYVISFVAIFNLLISIFLFKARSFITGHYLGLVLLAWKYTETIDGISNSYVQNFIRQNPSCGLGAVRSTFLEEKAKRNIKLYLHIAKIGIEEIKS